ncbi:MAG: glycoside hydrolase family 2 TIM barrel-domain containing protein, partial [Kiritimatiellae bacterium]|nr:glycoside hydrolase family 2 TIM barrel-domain containing protein [Kiritimatiellia bacterium]
MTDMRDGGGRQTIPLNNGWRFRAERAATAWVKGGWRSDDPAVDLPHCWNDRDTFKVGVRYRQGPGAYGLRFVLPQDLPPGQDCVWQLRSEGFYGVGDLWMNGKRVTSINGQYLGLREDVSLHVHPDRENMIGIRLTNVYRRYVLPGKRDPDFLLYGGLSGRVCLVRLPAVHLDERSLRAACEHPLAPRAVVRLSVEAANALATAQSVRLRAALVGPDGAVAASGQSEPTTVAARRSAALSLDLSVEHPTVWDLEHPLLYRAECELLVDGHPLDAVATPFGLREAVFDGNRGFFLNGNPVRLCGVNRHESVPGLGRALPEDLHRRDVEQIRSMGLNFVRLSHYPQHPAFLDACDRAGVLVYAEIASWKSVRPGPWARAACRQLEDMIRRDRHHPSIILWGLGNESRSRWAFRRMVRIAHALDPSRATVYAENHLHRGIRWRALNLTDVLGVNYELGILDEAHARSRSGAVVVSEISNCAYTPRGDEAAELKQIAAMERDLDLLEQKPYVAGYALWCYADYASQRKGRCRRQAG